MKCGLFDYSSIIWLSYVLLGFHSLCFCIRVFFPFHSLVPWLWRSWYQKYFRERWKLSEDWVQWGCLWLVRCRGGLRFWEFSVCGILGWMFMGSHYEDASLAFALLSIIDKWICNLRPLYHGKSMGVSLYYNFLTKCLQERISSWFLPPIKSKNGTAGSKSSCGCIGSYFTCRKCRELNRIPNLWETKIEKKTHAKEKQSHAQDSIYVIRQYAYVHGVAGISLLSGKNIEYNHNGYNIFSLYITRQPHHTKKP